MTTTLTNEVIAMIKLLFATIGSLKASRIVAEVATNGVSDEDDAYAAGVSLGHYGWNMVLLESGGTFGDEMIKSEGDSCAPDKVLLNKETKTVTFVWL